MALLGMRDVSWGFTEPPLLENITLHVEKGERICLLGRNGVGKSTLLKLLNGELEPDQGEVWRGQGVRVAALDQSVPPGFTGTVFDIVARGLGSHGEALAEYTSLARLDQGQLSPEQSARRDLLQNELDSNRGWELLQGIQDLLTRTDLDPQDGFAHLSAGMKRRVLFARALAREPDVLLLDEPTNHLDIDAILWMEDFIRRQVKTLLFITHDRAFLKQIANRIIELDRGRLRSYSCDYRAYLARREADLAAEGREHARFDKKLSQEEAWIRQGIKARRTRNQGRVRALKKMREAFRARRQKMARAAIHIQEAQRTGKLVIEARGIGKTYGTAPLIQDFSTLIMRGDKVGIIGPNGVGKSTLLRLLLKEEAPDTGRVRHGTHLEAVYFDQLRDQLDLQQSVRANIGEGNDYVTINGVRRHAISYLKDFLFTPDRCRTPVRVLSGGEQNRLLLAKLFLRPANVLVLDEPTNDLDVETLELLEERLFEYTGTLLLVSHDRAFLNNVATRTIAFDGDGRFGEYAGGYDDWLLQKPKPAKVPEKKQAPPPRAKPRPARRRKLTYREQQELEALPQEIDALESEQQELYARMADSAFFKKAKEEIVAVQARLEAVEAAISAGYQRWEELEQVGDGSAGNGSGRGAAA